MEGQNEIYAIEVKIINSATITIVNTIFWTVLHFGVSWLVTIIVPQTFYNHGNLLFKERAFENKLYKKIKISRWKDRLPQYNADFNKKHIPKNLTTEFVEQFIEETCRAELIHIAIGILGFSSIVFVYLKMESLCVFVVTATIISIAQIPFVLIQRYNRPRLIKLFKRMK